MAVAEQDAVIAELQERVDALELLMAKYVRTNGDGNGSAKRPTVGAPVAPAADDYVVKPLRYVRWPKPCFVCGVEVPAGTNAQWVPALKSKGLACAAHSEHECAEKVQQLVGARSGV